MFRRRPFLIGVCAAAVLVGAWVLVHSDRDPPTTTRSSAPGAGTCALSGLPREAADTVRRIQRGGPFPYPRSDGTVFGNREGHLPRRDRGYYHEYTVPTPHSRDRSSRRLVTGGTALTHPAQYFYTADHYDSFCLVTGTEQP